MNTLVDGSSAVRSAICGTIVLLCVTFSLGALAGARDAHAESGAAPDHHRPRYPCYRCPIIIGSGCATPIPPLPPGGLPIPPGVTPAPSATPHPSPTPGGQGGGAMSVSYGVCPQVEEEIPDHVKMHATTNPWTIYGFGLLRNPNVPYHPLWNDYRKWVSLRNVNLPYSPCNPAIIKAGCP